LSVSKLHPPAASTCERRRSRTSRRSRRRRPSGVRSSRRRPAPLVAGLSIAGSPRHHVHRRRGDDVGVPATPTSTSPGSARRCGPRSPCPSDDVGDPASPPTSRPPGPRRGAGRQRDHKLEGRGQACGHSTDSRKADGVELRSMRRSEYRSP
jgi:hypothetical protein